MCLLNRLITALLIFALVVDPAFAQVFSLTHSRPLPELSQPTLLTQALGARLTSYFRGNKEAIQTAFAAEQRLAAASDFELSAEGIATLQPNPWDFHLFFSKRTSNKPSKKTSPLTSPTSSEAPMGPKKPNRRDWLRWTIGTIGTIGAGIWGTKAYFDKPKPEIPPSTVSLPTGYQSAEQLLSLRFYMLALRQVLIAGPKTAAPVLQKAHQTADLITDAGWSSQMRTFGDALFQMLQQKPPRPEDRDSWLRKYHEAFDAVNENLLQPHGWILAPHDSESVFQIGRIQKEQVGEATNTVLDGSKTQASFPIIFAEIMPLSERGPAEHLPSDALTIGAPGHSKVVIDPSTLEADKTFFEKITRPAGPPADLMPRSDMRWVLDIYRLGFQKDGWLENGVLKPSFPEAFVLDVLSHEACHVLNDSIGFDLHQQDEASAHLMAFEGKMAFARIGKLLLALQSQIQIAQVRQRPPLDPEHPYDGSYLILAASAMADAMGDPDLGKRLREFDVTAVEVLGNKLITMDGKTLGEAAHKTRQRVGKKLPAHGQVDLIVRDVPQPMGKRAVVYPNRREMWTRVFKMAGSAAAAVALVFLLGHVPTLSGPFSTMGVLGGSLAGGPVAAILYHPKLETTRRRFFGIVATAMASRGVAFGQTASQSSRKERFPPLPFPERPAPLPARVQELIQAVDHLTRQFQDANIRPNPGQQGIQILAPNEDIFKARYNVYFAEINRLLWNPMWDDIRAQKWKTDAEIAAIQQRLQTASGEENFKNLFNVLLPDYFAHYNLFLFATFKIVGGVAIPDIYVGPVRRTQRRELKLEIFPKAISLRYYTLGPSLVRTLHEFYAPIDPSAALSTRWGTNQVLALESNFESHAEDTLASYEALVREHPKVAKAEHLLPADEPDPLAKAEKNMLASLVRPLLDQETREQVKARIALWDEEFNLRHESAHVQDGQTSSLNVTDNEIETRAGVGGAVGDPFVRYLSWRLMNFSLNTNAANRGIAQHASDFIYIRNRLGYWLWRDKELLSTLHLSLPVAAGDFHQFSELPMEVRTAIWDMFPLLTDGAWWTLYRHLWDELQTPANPLAKGLDQTDTRAADNGHVAPSMPPTVEPSIYWQKTTGIIVLIVGALGSLAIWRRRVLKGRANRRPQRSRGPTRRNFFIVVGPVLGFSISKPRSREITLETAS